MKTLVQKIFSLLFFLTFTAGISPALAQVDPDIEWKVLRLPHFDLVYDAKHQELAYLYGDRLEDNLTYLKQYFDLIPEKTTVILNDRTDLTNGYATPIPYRTMMLYPVIPGPSETISEYGDWARELSMHEMTHILSFEPRRDVVKGLYYIFGNIVTPNLLLPRWWLEGVAVDLETRTSEKGRLRSIAQDASIRAYHLDNALEEVTLGQINETSIYTWPQGGRPYLFGSYMWSELLKRHGTNTIKELHWRYGGRFPFFLEAPLEDLTRETYPSLFREMMTELNLRAAAQIKTLAQKEFSNGTLLEIKNSEETFFPQISPHGKNMILLSRSDAGKRSAIILQRPSLDVPFDDSQRLAKVDQKMDDGLLQNTPSPRENFGGIDENDSPPAGAIQRIAWFPTSLKFVFDQVQELNRFQETSDLYTFDLQTLKKERLTKGERAREASVSPNERQIVFVKLDAGRMHLAIFDVENKSVNLIYSPPLQNRISWPLFYNENEIVFTERNQGREILKKYNLTNKTMLEVLPDYVEAKYPTMTSIGLVFTSAKNGVSNLYLASPDLRSAKPLTHTQTLVAAGTFDPALKEFYAAELGSNGFKIKRFPAQNKISGELPKIESLMKDRYPPVVAKVSETDKSQVEDYSVWPYLYPRYWLPNFSYDPYGSNIGGSTGAADPLAKHSYQIAAAYDAYRRETNSAFVYTNNTMDPLFTLNGLDYNTNVINTSTRFRLQQYQLRALAQIVPVSTDLYSGFGWNWTARNFLQSRREQNGPSFIVNYSDYVQTGAQISPESGQAIGFQATEYLDNGAFENEAYRLYQFSLQKYFSGWARHHAIMARIQGQYIDGKVSAPNFAYNLGTAPSANFSGGGVISPFFVARGFLNGQFLGKNLNTANLEYRFPIQEIYRGTNDTTPIFFKRLHGAVIVDGVNSDGLIYKWDTETYESGDRQKVYWSAGAELKADITLAYQIPMTVFFGYYFPQATPYTKGSVFTFSIQL